MAVASKKEMMAEAIKHLEVIGVNKEIIEKFKKGIITNSKDYIGNSNDEPPVELELIITSDCGSFEKHFIDKWQKEYKGLVYYITQNNNTFLNLFYISPYKDEWQDDLRLLEKRAKYVYCENLQDEYLSEIGLIEFKIKLDLDGQRVAVRTA